MQMLDGWRGDGWWRNDLEVWSIGLSGSGVAVAAYAAGSEEACFEDDAAMTVFTLLQSTTYDVVFIDRPGRLRYHLFNISLDPSTRDLIDTYTRELLAEP